MFRIFNYCSCFKVMFFYISCLFILFYFSLLFSFLFYFIFVLGSRPISAQAQIKAQSLAHLQSSGSPIRSPSCASQWSTKKQANDPSSSTGPAPIWPKRMASSTRTQQMAFAHEQPNCSTNSNARPTSMFTPQLACMRVVCITLHRSNSLLHATAPRHSFLFLDS